jgi:DNA-binding NarL/FixJ family response regulator
MRVVFIDDDQLFLNLLERYFSHEPDMEVLAILSKGALGGLTNMTRAFRPDVVVVDLSMPHIPGRDLIGIMKKPENLPNAKYVILSGGDASHLRRAELDTGADRAISKSTDLKHLVQLIRSFEDA